MSLPTPPHTARGHCHTADGTACPALHIRVTVPTPSDCACSFYIMSRCRLMTAGSKSNTPRPQTGVGAGDGTERRAVGRAALGRAAQRSPGDGEAAGAGPARPADVFACVCAATAVGAEWRGTHLASWNGVSPGKSRLAGGPGYKLVRSRERRCPVLCVTPGAGAAARRASSAVSPDALWVSPPLSAAPFRHTDHVAPGLPGRPGLRAQPPIVGQESACSLHTVNSPAFSGLKGTVGLGSGQSVRGPGDRGRGQVRPSAQWGDAVSRVASNRRHRPAPRALSPPPCGPWAGPGAGAGLGQDL